ncbi:MAG: Holliday junction branch migration protein RuvA [Anaerolineae bacterium]
MIHAVRGRLRGWGRQFMIIDVGPMDLVVHVPASLLEAEWDIGDAVELFTYLHVREDEWTLYGFESLEQRRLFELLLEVNGIGPRLALSILSSFSPEVLVSAIAQGHADVIARAPGVGHKAAQRVVLHLQDKLELVGIAGPELAGGEADAELVEALRSLGYNVVEAQRVVQMLPKDVTDLEERLRLALMQLGRS